MSPRKQQARAIIVSSVSGGGKTTIIDEIRRRRPELGTAVTATSRSPRGQEKHGVHYYFYSREEFEEKLRAGEFLEHALVHGNYYGVPRGPVREKIDNGSSLFLNIDFQGKKSVVESLGRDRTLTIFILPPDEKVWEERLRGRATDTEEAIQRRLEDGKQELSHASEYDYRVVNEDLNQAVEKCLEILREEGLID